MFKVFWRETEGRKINTSAEGMGIRGPNLSVVVRDRNLMRKVLLE